MDSRDDESDLLALLAVSYVMSKKQKETKAMVYTVDGKKESVHSHKFTERITGRTIRCHELSAHERISVQRVAVIDIPLAFKCSV